MSLLIIVFVVILACHSRKLESYFGHVIADEGLRDQNVLSMIKFSSMTS